MSDHPSDHLQVYQFGSSDGIPVVFLHGFGGLGVGWIGMPALLGPSYSIIAFDMPGHGNSLDHSAAGSVSKMAKAIIGALDELGIDRFHLCGHSMGGAVSSLVALMVPDRVRSATLLAPGGYGTSVNAELLAQFASAETEAELGDALNKLYGKNGPVPEAVPILMGEREKPGVRASLMRIAETIASPNGQALLPIDALGKLPMPVHVVWGEDDIVVPIAHTKNLPENYTLHRLKEVNHVPQEEAPEAVRDVLLRAFSQAQ